MNEKMDAIEGSALGSKYALPKARPFERIIVGTGRCGSTLLSNIISQHPDILVLSEFFTSLDFARKYGQRMLTGKDFSKILDCGLRSQGDLKKITQHLHTPEIVYETSSEDVWERGSHYTDGVIPDLILIPLSALSKEPENLFDSVLRYTDSLPDALLGEHYRTLFHWLMGQFDKQVWIERSGGTIAHLPELLELFPSARILHIHRNAIDTSVSMQRHNHFRLRAFRHENMRTKSGVSWADLREEDLRNDHPISARLKDIMDCEVPLNVFGKEWNEAILRGGRAIQNLDKLHYKEVRFEDLMEAPAVVLEEISKFFELPSSAGWIDKAVKTIEPARMVPKSISGAEKAQLENICLPGQILLGQKPLPELYN